MEPFFELDPSEYFSSPTQVQLYNQHVKSKILCKQFRCDLSGLSDFPCIGILQQHNLGYFFGLDEPIYPNLVKVFYTNMEYPTSTPGGFRTLVNGTPITVTPQAINRFIRTSRPTSVYACTHKQFRNLEDLSERAVMDFALADALVPHQYETIHVLKKTNLSFDMQVFSELIQTILLPRKGHVDAVNLLDVWVMGALGLGIPLDIGYLISSYMHIARTHPQQSLPYGSLITLLLRKAGVDIDPDEPTFKIIPKHNITLATFKAKNWEKVGGVWRMKTKPGSGEASSSKRPRTEEIADTDEGPSGSRPSADENHQMVMARLDSLADSMAASFQSLRTHIDSRLDAQQAQLDNLEKIVNAYMGD